MCDIKFKQIGDQHHYKYVYMYDISRSQIDALVITENTRSLKYLFITRTGFCRCLSGSDTVIRVQHIENFRAFALNTA